jgi:hypothetical protein
VSPSGTPATWSVQARNLPEHAGNPIHTDEGGRAAGFRAGLVAGVTVYAYQTRPLVDAWGLGWLRGGGADVTFSSPVIDGDPVDCVPVATVDGATEVRADVAGETRARCTAWPADPPPVDRWGPLSEVLDPLSVILDGEWDGYGLRAGDDLALYGELGIVHPAVWPALANGMFRDQLVDGAWIHTTSRIRHFGVVSVGAEAVVAATVTDRFDTRVGSRAVADIVISVDEATVATVEHEAVVRLRDPA